MAVMYARLASREAFVLKLLSKVSSEGGAPLQQFSREFALLLLSHFCSYECRATPVMCGEVL